MNRTLLTSLLAGLALVLGCTWAQFSKDARTAENDHLVSDLAGMVADAGHD